MAARWRINLRPIPVLPQNVKHIINVSVVLHNFLTKVEKNYSDNGYGDRYQPNGDVTLGQWRNEISSSDKSSCCFRDLSAKSGQNYSTRAKQVRDSFKKYFNGDAGSVPWQFSLFNNNGVSEGNSEDEDQEDVTSDDDQLNEI